MFDVTRTGEAEHLAFSSGIHYCLGAALARLEAQIAFTELAARSPNLHRPEATGRTGDTPTRRAWRVIGGYARLPLLAG